MNPLEIEKLRYRRQYLIAPEQIECPFVHQQTSLYNNYTLYSHADLSVTEHDHGEHKLILLGDMFDYIHPENDNLTILKDLHERDFERFLEMISRYTGRFVLIYKKRNHIYLLTDATATRKVFYCNGGNKLWMASQSHLLAKLLGLGKTTNESKLAYYDSKEFVRSDFANVGNTTYYDEIEQLLPNHYLSVFDKRVSRFWPNKRIDYRPMGEVAEDCAKLVKGYMEAIASRYNTMLPVTSGNDSRLLLAGTQEITDKFFYYINRNPEFTEKYADLFIPQQLFKKLDTKFHVLDLPPKVDDDFRKIYFDNNPLATEKFLPHIYNYYLHHQDKVNLPGNFASAPFGVNKLRNKDVSVETLSKLYDLNDFEYAVRYCEKWLNEINPLCDQYNINRLNLFYWEERLANWGTQTQLDKDIAQDDINPLNSRILISHFLSVKMKYNNIPDYLLHRKIIGILWPELLKVPINPSLYNKVLKGLKILGLMGPINRIKFRLNL